MYAQPDPFSAWCCGVGGGLLSVNGCNSATVAAVAVEVVVLVVAALVVAVVVDVIVGKTEYPCCICACAV